MGDRDDMRAAFGVAAELGYHFGSE
jgi:hypothetical protein